MDVALILFVGGAVIVAWIFFWARMHQEAPPITNEVEQFISEVPLTSNTDAVLVSRDPGQLIYINRPARSLLGMNGGDPNLEYVARMAQPAETFLELFAGEKQAAFQLGTRWVEASSHRIPMGSETRTMVVIRELNGGRNGNGSSETSLDLSRAMNLINQIGENVNASLGVEQTLQTLLTLINQSIPFDAGEINIKDEQTGQFTPRGWAGDSSYLISLAEVGGVYGMNEGITGWIARHHQPVMLNAQDALAIRPKVAANPYQCIMGVPLMIGDTLIGTLELGALRANQFTPGDYALLQAISKPVTVAVYNASLYAEQVRRIEDITTLQQTIERDINTDSTATIFGTLTEHVAKLADTEMCGIFLYDEARRGLVPALPFYGLPDAVIRNTVISLPPDSPQRDIWERQPYWISNDVRDEPMVENLGLQMLVNLGNVQNTAWMPLIIGGERIGVLTVSNRRGGGFTPRDIMNLRALAAQTSIVVENVQLARREQSLDAQLAGLQEITYAIGALTQESEFYSEITTRIAGLMDIEMCGILVYDEEGQQLVSRMPFYGVEDELIKDYRISLAPGTVFEELWSEEEFWYSNRVSTDALVYAAGLDALATQLNVQKTLLAVLSTGGRKMGVVQVSNKRSGQDFTDSDARLLLIFATQAATIIENARLFQEVQQRSEQAQQLRHIAEIAGTIATSDEGLRDLLTEISSVMESEVVFVNVANQTGALVTYPRWVRGIELTEPIIQDMYAPGFEKSVIRARLPFITNDVLNDSRVLPSYRQIAVRFDLRNAIIVPLVIGDRGLGELGIANRPRPYTEDDLVLLDAIAAQISSALDRLLLYEATGQNLSRRIEELDSISRISNELTLTLDFDQILNVIRKEALNATGATGVTIALLHPQERWQSPDQPELDRRLGNARVMTRLADIEIEAVARGSDSVIIDDYTVSDYQVSPPEARSAIAASILYVEQVVGILHLYHTEPNHFDDQSAAFVVTLAAKASLGYGNAVRFQEQMERNERYRRRVDQLQRIFELGHMLPSNTEPLMVLEAVAYSVQQAVGFDIVLVLMVDEEAGVLRRVAHAGLPIDVFEKTRDLTISVDKMEQMLGNGEYLVSESYLFPVESTDLWYHEAVPALTATYDGKRAIEIVDKQSWRDGDVLLVPIRGTLGNLLGVISLDRPQDNRRPDRFSVEVLEIFAHQASTTLENTRLFYESQRNAERETRLSEVMEAVASTLDVGKIVEMVAQGLTRLVPFNRLTMALLDIEQKGFDVIRASVLPGSKVEITRDRRISLARTVLGRSYLDRSDYVYRSTDENTPEFEDLQRWFEQGEKIGIVVPLITGGECLGAMHIGSDRADTRSFADAQTLFKRVAQLVAASVQNARLFNQAVGLQVLNESVVESIQQGIVSLNNSGKIISINGFMRQRYGWGDDASGQDLFAYRPELAALVSKELRYVLEMGVPQERINQMTVEDHDRLLVRNFYIYPLRYDNSVRGAVMLIEDVTERAKLEEAMEARANQLAALTEVSTRITSSLERDEVIALALQEMRVLIRYNTMTTWRRNGSFMVLEGFVGADNIDTGAETRIRISDFERVRQVVDTQRVTVINSETPIVDLLPGEALVKSWMGVPLVNQGHVVGMLVLTQPTPYAYESKSDQNIAFAFASQVAISLANADLFEQTFDRTNELGTLLEAAQATSVTQDLDQIFRTVTELMLSALEMDQCTIMIWDEVDNNLEVQIDVNRQGDSSRVRAPGTQDTLLPNSARLFALRQREVVVLSREDQETPYPEEMQSLYDTGATARMLVPLVAREGSIGLIQLDQHAADGRMMTQQKVRLARALGSQVAIAIQNARLSSEMAEMFNEALIINDLSRGISSKLNVDDMIAIVRDQVPAVTQSDELYLALYDAGSETITFPLAVKGGKEYTIPPRLLGTDEVSFIIRHGRQLSLGADYFSTDELRRSLGITNGEGDAKSYLGVPLKAGDQVFGVLALRDTTRTRAFTINDQRILETVGSQLGAAIQNAELFKRINALNQNLNQRVLERTQELEDERDRLDTLYQITSELARTLDMERLQQQAIGMVSKAVNAEDAVIFGLDPLTDALFTQAFLDPSTVYDNEDGTLKVHPAESLASWLIQNEHSLVVDDLHTFEHWDMSAPGAIRWRSALGVVLESNQNDPQGVMVLLSTKVAAFGEPELRLLIAAANQVASSINNADLYHLIRDQAERLGTLLRAEQEEAEKNSAILESIADGVILSDADGKVILFNTAAERILGLPREQVLGQPLSKFTGMYGSEVAAWAQTIQDRTARAELDAHDEFVNERINLSDKIVSAHLSPVYTGDKLLGMVSVFRDITRDVEVDRMKSDFISNVSHEFRTPLTSIKGYNDLILMGAMGELNEMQKRAMGTIKENIDRLTILVEDVLDISKIDSGRERLKIERMNVGETIDGVLNALQSRPQHQRKLVAVSVGVEPENIVIEADRDKVNRILSNLIDNAFNYTPSGGSVDIRAKLQADGKRVLFSIQDTGVGIPEQYRDRIWNRFQRIEEHALTMDVAGTGLGLSIVKEMTEMHTGEVWFESEVGKGTTFYVSLPVEPPDYLKTRTSTGTYRQVGND
jgi:PAS domain S-box-containing protein